MNSPFDAPSGEPARRPPPPPGPATAEPTPGPTPAPPPPPTAVPPPPDGLPAMATTPTATPTPAPTQTPASTATPTPSTDTELDDVLARLHDELEIERSDDVPAGAELTDARDLERPPTEHIVVESEGGIHFDPTFAGFPARFAGYVVDCLILALAMAPGVLIALSGSAVATLAGAAVSFAGFVVVTVLAARSIAASGKFVGNRVSGTEIVDTRTGRRLDTSSAAARFALRHTISSIFFIGFVPAFFDGQRRTFHDRVVTSIVVTRPREVWTAGDGSAA